MTVARYAQLLTDSRARADSNCMYSDKIPHSTARRPGGQRGAVGVYLAAIVYLITASSIAAADMSAVPRYSARHGCEFLRKLPAARGVCSARSGERGIRPGCRVQHDDGSQRRSCPPFATQRTYCEHHRCAGLYPLYRRRPLGRSRDRTCHRVSDASRRNAARKRSLHLRGIFSRDSRATRRAGSRPTFRGRRVFRSACVRGCARCRRPRRDRNPRLR